MINDLSINQYLVFRINAFEDISLFMDLNYSIIIHVQKNPSLSFNFLSIRNNVRSAYR